MRTLQETMAKMGGAGQTLRKHLTASGITEWGDISRSALYDFRDHLAEVLAPTSQKTVMAYLKSILNRVKDDIDVPSDYEKILVAKATSPVRTYLTEDDLRKFEGAKTNTLKQEFVKNVFLICAYTGLRLGDAMNLTVENVADGNLHYVAQKTKKAGAIPLKKGLEERIKWISGHKEYSVSRAYYNETVRNLCKDAGIDEDVLVFKAGEELRGPKWMFISSHNARISTATCLSRRGVGLQDIQTLLQHSSVSITEHYIIKDRVNLSEKAMEFFA